MKTPVVRKPQTNIINPYENVLEQDFQILSPEGKIEATKILSNGDLHEALTVNTYIYVVPAHFATIRLDSRYNNMCMGYGFYTPLLKNVLLEEDKKFITITKDPKDSNAKYYHHNLGSYYKDSQGKVEENTGKSNLVIPREIFKDINDFVYFLVSCNKTYKPVVKYSLLPKNQPFFWDKPVATSIYDNQPLSASRILLGSIRTLKDNPQKEGQYVLEKLDDIYHWEWKDSEKNILVWDGCKDERDEVENPICHIEYKDVVCYLASGEIVSTETIPVYAYKRNRNGKGHGITAFVWRSGNEDDLVKKSQVGYEEGDDKFYNNYPHLLESLSLGAIYHSYASLTHISSENVARYVLRYIAHQPEGYRSVSIEGHLLYLMGGPLYHIKEIFDEYRDSNKNEDEDSKSQLPELTIEDFYRVQSLYDINKSLLHYDSNVAYVPVESYRKIYPNATKIYNEQIHYVRDILGIPEGSNGCKQLQILLDEIFAHIKDAGIIVDYVSSDIEFICNEARMLLVNRFTTKYLSAMTSYWDIKEPLSLHYKNLYKEIYHDLYFRNALQSLGYIFNGNGLDDLKSVPTGDDDANQMYGIANGKAYVERRNINVWDVVMKNYTNDLFADIFSPIRLSFPKVKCSADSRFDSKGYLNRAEMFETYLGGSVKLGKEWYSSIPLYGDHMTRGHIKPNMDNWHILPKPTLFSFFMDHINRMRVTALSSEGKFNVYVPTWNMWAFELNKQLEFCKDNVFAPDKVSRDIIEKYYAELLYHTFLMNPDKAIAYFNLDSTVRDKTHYIELSTESGGYFKYAYDSLEGLLKYINDELGEGPIVPQTQTLAVETEPYVLSCAEVNNKWIWRLTVKELSNRNNIEFKNGSITFESEGRKITFSQVENNPLEDIDNNKVGFWITTPVDIKPQMESVNEKSMYYYHHPACTIGSVKQDMLSVIPASPNDKKNYAVLRFFDYRTYTLFGELPKRHSMCMEFCIDHELSDFAKCELLDTGFLNLKCVLWKSDNVLCCKMEAQKKSSKTIELSSNSTYIVKLDIDITSQPDRTSFEGKAVYHFYEKGEDNPILKEESNFAYHASSTHYYLISTLNLCKFYDTTAQKVPIIVEDFRLYFSGHQEKVELFRESNGLNITRVNKEVAAYANSKIEADFTDRIIAKFSWLNAEQRSIVYNLPFELTYKRTKLPLRKVIRPDRDIEKRLFYPHDGRLTIRKVTDKQIILEVAPNSEGYMLFQITKNPVTITDATCIPEEIIDDVNPDAIYHVM